MGDAVDRRPRSRSGCGSVERIRPRVRRGFSGCDRCTRRGLVVYDGNSGSGRERTDPRAIHESNGHAQSEPSAPRLHSDLFRPLRQRLVGRHQGDVGRPGPVRVSDRWNDDLGRALRLEQRPSGRNDHYRASAPVVHGSMGRPRDSLLRRSGPHSQRRGFRVLRLGAPERQRRVVGARQTSRSMPAEYPLGSESTMGPP